jgi:hypothetical protein
LPDVSLENNHRENFASAFAGNQFGRKQTIGRKRLQEGEMEGLRRISQVQIDWRSPGFACPLPRQTDILKISQDTFRAFF